MIAPSHSGIEQLGIQIPPPGGWQVLRELKRDEVTRNIPVIVLSIVDERSLGYELGAFDYLLKPINPEALLASLARIARIDVAAGRA